MKPEYKEQLRVLAVHLYDPFRAPEQGELDFVEPEEDAHIRRAIENGWSEEYRQFILGGNRRPYDEDHIGRTALSRWKV